MSSFAVQLVSPEKVLYEGEAQFVVARTLGGGDIGFLPGHAPFLGALADWPVRVKHVDGSELAIACHGGFVQVDGTKVVILSDIAELAGDIDVARAQAAKAAAEAVLAGDADDVDAKAALYRAVTRLDVAGA